MSERQFYVYIITNHTNSVLYVGVTNNLIRRMEEHRSHKIEGFSKRYNLYKLVYYDYTNNVRYAIEYEKKLKKYRRQQKIDLIKKNNPDFEDLYYKHLVDR